MLTNGQIILHYILLPLLSYFDNSEDGNCLGYYINPLMNINYNKIYSLGLNPVDNRLYVVVPGKLSYIKIMKFSNDNGLGVRFYRLEKNNYKGIMSIEIPEDVSGPRWIDYYSDRLLGFQNYNSSLCSGDFENLILDIDLSRGGNYA